MKWLNKMLGRNTHKSVQPIASMWNKEKEPAPKWNTSPELWDDSCRESLEAYLQGEPGKVLSLLMVHWLAEANEKACEEGVKDRQFSAGVANGMRKMRSNILALTIKQQEKEGPLEVTDDEVEKRLQARILHRFGAHEVEYGHQ